MSDSTPLPRLPPRRADSHKGDFGRALLIGGSTGMSGAISLAGMATLRGGAGLVRLAVPLACLPTVAAHEPSYMTVGLPCDPDGRIGGAAWQQLSELAAEATAIACGPGLGQSDELTELVAWMYNNLTQPVVFDADALNALAQRPAALDAPAGPRVLTPHPGEFARLLGRDTREALANRESLAGVFAVRTQAVIVVKGHRSYVTDGQRAAHNTTGNPGMATGGSGDVLTGLITALLCQGLPPFDATRLAVHVHGLAGDLAARDIGQIGLIASDLVRYLPAAFRALEAPVD